MRSNLFFLVPFYEMVLCTHTQKGSSLSWEHSSVVHCLPICVSIPSSTGEGFDLQSCKENKVVYVSFPTYPVSWAFYRYRPASGSGRGGALHLVFRRDCIVEGIPWSFGIGIKSDRDGLFWNTHVLEVCLFQSSPWVVKDLRVRQIELVSCLHVFSTVILDKLGISLKLLSHL